jgi:hypothetical protein
MVTTRILCILSFASALAGIYLSTRGLPQWEVLSPFGFSVFLLAVAIYDVADRVNHHVLHGYHHGDQSWRIHPLG